MGVFLKMGLLACQGRPVRSCAILATGKGGRAAYTLATALFIGAAGLFGWFTHLFEWLPRAAMFPILVYVGLEITSQSFRQRPRGTIRRWPCLFCRRWRTWPRFRWT
jgi:hypothetical protein